MITSIKTVHASFFGEFTGTPVNITYKGVGKTVPVIFQRASADDYAEMKDEDYPVISIQDYIPRPSNDWHKAQEHYYDGYEDTDNDGIFDTVREYTEPVKLDFRYDVSVAAKTRGEYDALVDYIMKRFEEEGRLILDKRLLPNNEIAGYPVWYKNNPINIPRSDGVQETNFQFTFSCFIDLKDPEDKILIQQFNISINNG